MARGKPNRIMLGLLGVAVLALLTDQLLPASSHADEAFVPTGTEAQAIEAAPSPDALRNGPTLSDRFAGFEQPGEPDRDAIGAAFAPLATKDESTGPAAAEPESNEVGLKLSAILRREDGNIAVINGRPLRVGDSIDGARILSIEGQRVRVETAVGAITLELQRPKLQAD